MVGLSLRQCAFFWRNCWIRWTVCRRSCLQRRRASHRHRINICLMGSLPLGTSVCSAAHILLLPLSQPGNTWEEFLWPLVEAAGQQWTLLMAVDQWATDELNNCRSTVDFMAQLLCLRSIFWCQSHLTENESQQCTQGQTFAQGLNKTYQSVITINWSTSLLTKNPTCEGAQH